jgi:hypothetical protein
MYAGKSSMACVNSHREDTFKQSLWITCVNEKDLKRTGAQKDDSVGKANNSRVEPSWLENTKSRVKGAESKTVMTLYENKKEATEKTAADDPSKSGDNETTENSADERIFAAEKSDGAVKKTDLTPTCQNIILLIGSDYSAGERFLSSFRFYLRNTSNDTCLTYYYTDALSLEIMAGFDAMSMEFPGRLYHWSGDTPNISLGHTFRNIQRYKIAKNIGLIKKIIPKAEWIMVLKSSFLNSILVHPSRHAGTRRKCNSFIQEDDS